MKEWIFVKAIAVILLTVSYVAAQQVEQTPMQQALDRFMLCQVQNVNHNNQQAQEFYAKIQEKQVLLDAAQKQVAELKQKLAELQSGKDSEK